MMRFWKHELPVGIISDDEVCIGWASLDAWSKHIHSRTKRFCYAKMLPVPCEGYPKELCAAIVVKRSEMIELGYEERENIFYKRFDWEDQ